MVTQYSVTDSGFQEIDLSFKLNQLSAHAEFEYLFDSYKIESVECTFVYDFNSSNVTAGAVASVPALPILGYVVDYDDDATLGSEGAFMQYDNFKFHRMDTPFTLRIAPRCAIAVYNSATTTGYANSPPIWIDLANNAVPHYGLKFYIRNPLNGAGSTIVGQLSLFTRFHVSLRHPR